VLYMKVIFNPFLSIILFLWLRLRTEDALVYSLSFWLDSA
jgi:hypothetical protein